MRFDISQESYGHSPEMSNSFLRGLAFSQPASDTLELAQRRMPKSRTKNELLTGFGGVLDALHRAYAQARDKKFSHEARLVRTSLSDHGISVAGSTLWRWEKGEVKGVDAVVLQALAHIYGLTLQDIMVVLEANLQNPHLSQAEALAMLSSRVRSDHPLISLIPGSGPFLDRREEEKNVQELEMSAISARQTVNDEPQWGNTLRAAEIEPWGTDAIDRRKHARRAGASPPISPEDFSENKRLAAVVFDVIGRIDILHTTRDELAKVAAALVRRQAAIIGEDGSGSAGRTGTGPGRAPSGKPRP